MNNNNQNYKETGTNKNNMRLWYLGFVMVLLIVGILFLDFDFTSLYSEDKSSTN